MIVIEMRMTPHEWEKKNLTTLLAPKKGCYDVYQCRHCGLEGRSYRFGVIEIPKRYAKRIYTCKRQRLGKSVKVTHCRAVGPQFENLTDGSVHTIIDPPKGQDNRRGEWVMGNGEAVLLLWDEFEYIEDKQ